MNAPELDRPNISEEAATAVRRMIVDGTLPEGERINEVHLARRLNVSRTPLREALNRLAAEGAIASRPRIGFFVRPLTIEEAQELYAIRPILDPAALRMAGIPPAARQAKLKRLNARLAAERDPEAVIALDDEWHLLLLADCPNGYLMELIHGAIQRSRRYELALFRETRNAVRAGEDHERVLTALAAGDLDGACEALKQNMDSGLPPLIAWLKGRKRPEGICA